MVAMVMCIVYALSPKKIKFINQGVRGGSNPFMKRPFGALYQFAAQVISYLKLSAGGQHAKLVPKIWDFYFCLKMKLCDSQFNSKLD